MMVTLARRAARIPFAPVVAVMFGLATAILVAAMPAWMFERAVTQSGLAAVLPLARPPLGLTARLLAVLAAFVAVSGLLWLALAPLSAWLERDRRRRTPWHDETPVTAETPLPEVSARRRPIFAPQELGAPLMSDEAIAAPLMAPEPELLELEPEYEAPVQADEPAPLDKKDKHVTESAEGDNSIHALIRRLESGLARRTANDPGPDAPAAAPLSLSRDWMVHDEPAEPARSEGASEEDDARQRLSWLRQQAVR